MLNRLNGYQEGFPYDFEETWGSRRFKKSKAHSAHRKRWNLRSILGARSGAAV